jgi:hypothetical protein
MLISNFAMECKPKVCSLTLTKKVLEFWNETKMYLKTKVQNEINLHKPKKKVISVN